MANAVTLDNDLVRRIVLDTCDQGQPQEIGYLVDDDYSRRVVGQHVDALVGEGYLRASYLPADNNPYYAVMLNGLTREGVDLAQSMRSPDVWSDVKRRLRAVGGSVSLSVLAEVVGAAVRARLGLS